jgi:hypothetical protein
LIHIGVGAVRALAVKLVTCHGGCPRNGLQGDEDAGAKLCVGRATMWLTALTHPRSHTMPWQVRMVQLDKEAEELREEVRGEWGSLGAAGADRMAQCQS